MWDVWDRRLYVTVKTVVNVSVNFIMRYVREFSLLNINIKSVIMTRPVMAVKVQSCIVGKKLVRLISSVPGTILEIRGLLTHFVKPSVEL